MTTNLTDAQAYRRGTFQAATKGLSNWRIALALNLLNPGLDWRGSSKGDMLKAWIGQGAFDLSEHTGSDLRGAIARITREST